jgi:hypothetical protein
MYGCPWDFFPARLHSTREIIFFLENITKIQEVIEEYPIDLANCIFGGIYHPCVIDESKQFMQKPIQKTMKKIIIEISSRKVKYYNDIPVNYFYSEKEYDVTQYTLVPKLLTDEEIEYDIDYIRKLCREIFQETTEIHIIPHLNLKTRAANAYIGERDAFVTLLECVCAKYNIALHNVGKYIEESNGADSCLEDYMADSYHYSKGHEHVKAFLIRELCR